MERNVNDALSSMQLSQSSVSFSEKLYAMTKRGRAGEDHKTNLGTTDGQTTAAAAPIRKVKFSFTVSEKERHMV